MIDAIHIIGCGNIGSNLAIKIAQSRITKHIIISDFDIVSRESDHYIYPFSSATLGLMKAQVVKNMILCNIEDTVVDINEELVLMNKIDAVHVDCRDRKNRYLNCDLRISLDGHLLILDSLHESHYDFSSYCLSQKFEYIDMSTSIALSFLSSGKYKERKKRMFDLDRLIDDFDILTQ